MRFAWSVALILIGSAFFTGAANASPVVKLRVAFHPNLIGHRTTIELALRIGGPGGAVPAPVRSLDLRLPAGMGIATTTLGQRNCDPADLILSGLHGCSANARIGFGQATAIVPVGTQAVQEQASLNVLMGPPAEDRVEVLFYVEALGPVFAQLILPSVVDEDSQPYGERLDTNVPLVQAWPEGPDLALETFDSTIGPLHLTYFREVNGKSVAYYPHGVKIPQVCPAGGYPFAALLTFQGGEHTNTTYRVPCPRK
jgi:hypothetical protein